MNRVEKIKLGDLVDFVGGGTPRRDRADYWGGKIPWASVKDLTSQTLETTIESITPEGLANSASNIIPKDTVIIASRVGLGKVAINEKPVAINQDLKALTPKTKRLSPRYLLLYLLSKAEYFESIGVGATVKGLTLLDYQKLEIALPSLEEQERIVTLLDEADALRKLRARADQRTASLTAALFNKMFGDPETNSKGWPLIQLGDIAPLKSGYAFKSSEYTASGVRLVRISNFDGQNLVFEAGTAYLPETHFNKYPAYQLAPNDILIAMSGATTGKLGMVRTADTPSLLNQRVGKFFIRDKNQLDAQFLFAALNLPNVMRTLIGEAAGSAQPNVSPSNVGSVKIPLPPLALQKEFADRVKEIRELESTQSASRNRLDNLFQSLLHRAFNEEL